LQNRKLTLIGLIATKSGVNQRCGVKEILCGVEMLHSKTSNNLAILGLRRGGREIPGFYDALKIYLLVGAIAKGLRLRMPAAAEANRGPVAEAEGLAFLVENLKIAFHTYRAIIPNRDLCNRH